MSRKERASTAMRASKGFMKIALLLLCWSLLALAATALLPHQPVAASRSQTTSEALADAMSSHGIETGDSSSGAVGFKTVSYTPQAGSQ